MIRSILTIIFVLQSLSIAGSKVTFDCFSILVGKNASKDGAVLFAHNEDDGGLQVVEFYKVPAREHLSGEKIELLNGGRLSQTSNTNAYLWLEMPGMQFSDSYMNEYGVVIASDQCRSRENDPELTDGGIGYWLRRAVAERARTAKQAVRIAGQFIEKFGYASSGRTYVIADPKEGWMLSAVYGKHWIAQRVPDDKVAVIPNFYTIGSVDLADTLNFLGSSDIIDYAVKNNWYDPDNQKPFHFSKVYSDPETLLHPNNIKRMWRGVNLLSKKEYKLADDFPFAFTPNKNVSVQDLTSILRDHYLNTEFDHTHNLTAGNPHLKNEHTICASHNQYGFVAQLRNGLPKKMGCVLWIALRRPCSQPFIPWYLGLEQIPNGYNTRNYKQALIQHFNPPEWLYQPQDFFSFWSFIIYTKQLDQNYSQMLDTAKSYYKDTERFLFKNQYAFEKKVLAVYKDNPQKADKMLTDYTCKWANKVWERIKSAD